MSKKYGSQSQEPNLQEYAVNKSIYERRAREFQGGHNPMHCSAFEKKMIHKEAEERWNNKKHYIHGIQGVDGGECTGEDREKY